jgi:AcrR family transcriptional regulator
MAKDSRRGARGTLSRTELVESALRIADTEGLEALTIRRLATDHGVTPMAVYWHFRDKDQLLGAVAERLFADVEAPDHPAATTWPERLRAELGAFLKVMRSHPAVAGLNLTRLLDSEAGLAVAERVLALLAQAGFPPDEAAEVGSYLMCATITLVTTEPGPEAVLEGEARDDAVRQRRAYLGALSPSRFPHILAAADTLSDCRGVDQHFARGLDLLVAGTRSLLAPPA